MMTCKCEWWAMYITLYIMFILCCNVYCNVGLYVAMYFTLYIMYMLYITM